MKVRSHTTFLHFGKSQQNYRSKSASGRMKTSGSGKIHDQGQAPATAEQMTKEYTDCLPARAQRLSSQQPIPTMPARDIDASRAQRNPIQVDGQIAEVTTVMVRQIEHRVNMPDLFNAFNVLGFKHKYDLIYLPVFHREGAHARRMHAERVQTIGQQGLPSSRPGKAAEHRNRGFAVVNFTTPEHAESFMQCAGALTFPRWQESSKECEVRSSRSQGFEAVMAEYTKHGGLIATFADQAANAD